LLMAIADAIARTSDDYDFEIGKRGMVALSAEIHDAVVGHFSDEPFSEPQFFGEPESYTNQFAYDDGYALGVATAEKTPLEIFDAGVLAALDTGPLDQDFDDGFRDGLNDGYDS
jgi:hypothetical protein